jgi:hypothetical protein
VLLCRWQWLSHSQWDCVAAARCPEKLRCPPLSWCASSPLALLGECPHLTAFHLTAKLRRARAPIPFMSFLRTARHELSLQALDMSTFCDIKHGECVCSHIRSGHRCNSACASTRIIVTPDKMTSKVAQYRFGSQPLEQIQHVVCFVKVMGPTGMADTL